MGASPKSGSDGKPVQVEVVTGEREAVYWEKVPEKVRRQAVEKAVGMKTNGGEGPDNGQKRKRKKGE